LLECPETYVFYWEVSLVKVCSRPSRGSVGRDVALLGVVAVTFAGTLGAQTIRKPDDDAKYTLVVPAFTSPDKILGCKTAQEVRDRLDGDLNYRKLPVVPKDHVDQTLQASVFPVCDPITPSDTKQLASQLRADYIVDGYVNKQGDSIRVYARLVLARDVSFSQPLPMVKAKGPGDAAKLVSKEFQAALAQIPGETECYNDGRDPSKYPQAIAAARTAIAAYPPSTLARLCIANIYENQKQAPDSIIALTTAILQVDSTNRRSLELAGQAYYDKKDYDNAVRTWTRLIATDPSNTDLVERVVTQIVQSGHADQALPIMDQVVKANPGDPKLEELQYRLQIVTKHYQTAAPLGDQVAKEDTAFADTLFFLRQVTAYAADSQPQKAAEEAARGLAKFPTNVSLQTLQAQQLISAGQLQQAKPVLLNILSKNPKAANAGILLATIYSQTGQNDSTLWALHMVAAADTASRSTAAKFALTQGNVWYKKGNASKNVDTLDVAIKYLAYSDSLDASPTPKFLMGASAFTAGYVADQAGAASKDCTTLKKAQDYFNVAQANVPAGLQMYPEPAKQILTALQQVQPIVGKQIKAVCK
jgi:tetratricopeptide (TPR) repeat protein